MIRSTQRAEAIRNRKTDRLFVQEVFAGKHRSGLTEYETPALTQLKEKQPDNLPSTLLPWGLAACGILLFSTSAALVQFELGIAPPILPFVIFIGLIYIAAFLSAISRECTLKRYSLHLEDVAAELQRVFGEIKESIDETEDHLKSSLGSDALQDSYIIFILQQIRESTELRLKKIAIVLTERNVENLMFAYFLLVKPISVRESRVEGVGRRIAIPLSRVKSTVFPLVNYLQDDLTVIDKAVKAGFYNGAVRAQGAGI